jgi:hypothetical protein
MAASPFGQPVRRVVDRLSTRTKAVLLWALLIVMFLAIWFSLDGRQ